MAQTRQSPDLDLQRTAMKKLSFLVGKWSGEARISRRPGETSELTQFEEAQYKLDGLLLMIEGKGLTKTDGKPVLQALGIISYDDATATYHMRAYNDGRYLETEMKLAEGGNDIVWGFGLGEIKFNSQLRINERGEWTELHEITVGAQPPRKFMELKVSKNQ
jgi:hypothetical protein